MTLVRKRLHQLGRVVTGKTPPTARQELFQGEYLFVTPSDLDYNHYYCRSAERTVSEQAKATLRNQFIPANAVMFTCIGATIGKCGIAPSECLTNQQINSVIANDECDPRYLYYLLCNSVDIVKGMGGGAATPIVNKSKFENIDFFVPPLRQQQEIGRILSAYDDMIENNRRRIALLEEAARLLYREWFVHFRFPGHEHAPLSDGLPDGWERRTLGDVAGTNRESYRAKELPDEIDYIDISSVAHGRVISRTRMPVSEAPGRARRKVRDGDVIWSNVRPNLRAYALILDPEDLDVVSTGFTVLSASSVPFTWLYMFVTMDGFVGHLINHATGAGYPAVRPDDFERAEVFLPPKPLLDHFHEATEPNFRLIRILDQQNRKLAEARDLLLPRLMNGEITV